MGGVTLGQNYGYTVFAGNKAEKVADDGVLTPADLKNLAGSGPLTQQALVANGFAPADAAKILQAVLAGTKSGRATTVQLLFPKSALQQTVAATTAFVARTTTEAVHVAGKLTASGAKALSDTRRTLTHVAGVVKAEAVKTYHKAETKTVALTGQVRAGIARSYDQTVTTLKTAAKDVRAFDRKVTEATGPFVRGVGNGVVHGVVHLGESIKDFAVEHPYITGAIVIGAAALITVASGGIGGPLAVGLASGALTGLSYAGMAAGAVITTVKVGQSIHEVSQGHFEQAGEKFGEAGVEAAVTFLPGQGVKALKHMTHAAQGLAKDLTINARLGADFNALVAGINETRGVAGVTSAVPGVSAVPKMFASAIKVAGRAETLYKVEKSVHAGHQVLEGLETTAAKGTVLIDLVQGATGKPSAVTGHGAPKPEGDHP